MRLILNLTVVLTLAATSIGQDRDFYDYKPSRNRSYLQDGRPPLFPFGYGLSYTTCKFENLRVEPQQIGDIMVGPSSATTSAVPLRVMQPSFKSAEAPPGK